MAQITAMQSHYDQDLFWRLVEIDRALSCEKDKWKLFERILIEAQAIANADGGTLYLVNDREECPKLEYVIVRNAPLNISIINKDAEETGLKPIPIYLPDSLRPNHTSIASHCALTKQVINLEKAYQATDYDISGIQNFDAIHNYRTHNLLSIPLTDHGGRVVGIIQLINARSTITNQVIPFSPETIKIIEALASLVSIVVDNHIMMEEQQDLLIRISSKQQTGELFEAILQEAQSICHAEGGSLYLLEDSQQPKLKFAIIKNNKLNIHQGGTSEQPVDLPPIPLYLEDGQPNHQNVASFTALTKQLINIPDAYSDQRFDFSGTKAFDKRTGYRSTSFLSIPLVNHEDEVIGVLQLVNATNPRRNKVIPFGSRIEPIIRALSAYAAIALENQILLEDHKKLLDAFIQCIAKAIDAKSPHTSAHCQKVPVLTEMLAQATCNDNEHFPDFALNEQEWYELHVAAWLHDCGKLSTPDSVLDKSTKLHGLRDGIDAVLARMDAIGQQWRAQFYQQVAHGKETMDNEAELEKQLLQLAADKAFLVEANKGGEFMTEESKERVRQIADYQWQDESGVSHKLLAEDDIANLCIERGTLNTAERQRINDHISVSIEMLNSLPFPKTLRRVPEYAGGHHEKMDGSGFPKGLKRNQMSVPARIMAIADIFEALTSSDRPYKQPMKISQALSILKKMRDQNHIDPDLYQVFLKERVWETYAKNQLKPEQLDVSSVEDYQ